MHKKCLFLLKICKKSTFKVFILLAHIVRSREMLSNVHFYSVFDVISNEQLDRVGQRIDSPPSQNSQ